MRDSGDVGPMTVSLDERPDSPSRVLLFSQRNIYEVEVWRSAIREFEEIVGEIDSVDVLAPQPLKWFKQRKRIALRVGRDSRIVLNPGVPRAKLDRRYDLFVAVCEKPSELLNVNAAMEHWKDSFKTSVCWLTELWVQLMPVFTSSLKVLSNFDYVFSSLSQSVEPINGVIRGRCFYMPFGVDTVLFFPFARPVKRLIDVLSIGRRSEREHQALLKMARDGEIFYIYDTLRDLHTHDLQEHRFLLASMAKRSRYFVVHPGKLDRADERGHQKEMGSRFFEGAAAGTIMIGERSGNEQFEKEASWPDAVIDLPRQSGGIEDVIREMDGQPDRQAHMRSTNVIQSLLRHDWVYRWEAVLRMAGLEPMPQLLKRKETLRRLARMVQDKPLASEG